ncbi:MAG: DNA adenine methylase [Promethearchaeota archaeon]|jgi:DNA adenine methylase
MRPFIRYPGGKSKQADKILQYFRAQEKEYREPFVGGGSVYLADYHFPNAWINDLDPEVYDLWMMVRDTPMMLINQIEEHTPILDHRRDKHKIKKALNLWNEVRSDTNHKLYCPGYRFLFLSKTCFSGVVTGGPTGGLAQTGNYNLTSRWAKNQTIKRIRFAHEKIQDCKITLGSWQPLIEKPGKDVALYLDPPYLEKGDQCYRFAFTLKDHKELAEAVVVCEHRWVVTIDDIPDLRNVWLSVGVPAKRLVSKFWKYSMDGTRKENRIGQELFVMDKQSYELAQEKESLWQ